jgi:hypothetical protein
MTHGKGRLAPQVGPWIARDRHVLNVTSRDAAHLEAGADRRFGKSGDVLDAAEALLFDGGHEDTVPEQYRGDVTVVGVDAENSHGH